MHDNKKPLVTVAVLVYRNFQYIKDCVGSILEQDYPRIQLIVSDDGGDDFDAEELERFIQGNQCENIQSVYIHQMEKNVGTSKNFNFALSHSEGKYVKFIAADDLFYDVDSLSKLVKAAELESSNVVIARAPNYDRYLEKYQGIYPSDEHWGQMRGAAGNSKEFFGLMSQYCLISAPSTLFNREFLNQKHGADEKYRLIEDWPLWMKMLRGKETFTFLNEPVVIYRSGGVSNGKKNVAFAYHQIEYADVILHECLSHPEAMASKEQYRLAKESERGHRFNGERLILHNSGNLMGKLAFCLRYADIYSKLFIEKLASLFWKLSAKKRMMLLLGVLFLAVFSMTDTEALLGLFCMEKTAHQAGLFMTRLGLGIGLTELALGGILYAGSIPVTFFRTIKYSGE